MSPTKGHEAEAWEWILARGEDIGHGVVIRFFGSGDRDRAGILLYHRHDDGSVCGGAVRFGFPWKVESLDPLTLTPSIRDKSCGLHGHITQGRWIPSL